MSNNDSDLFEGFVVNADDVEIPAPRMTFDRVYARYANDRTGAPLLDQDGNKVKELVLDMRIPGVTDNWEGGVKTWGIKMNSRTMKDFLAAVKNAGFELSASPSELTGETFEANVEERTWTNKDGSPGRWIIHWPGKHIEP